MAGHSTKLRADLAQFASTAQPSKADIFERKLHYILWLHQNGFSHRAIAAEMDFASPAAVHYYVTRGPARLARMRERERKRRARRRIRY